MVTVIWDRYSRPWLALVLYTVYSTVNEKDRNLEITYISMAVVVDQLNFSALDLS